jgi:hypothetical protein
MRTSSLSSENTQAELCRVQNASTNVLEHLLDHESCDVDPRNRQHGDTPLHIAIRQKWEDHEGLRLYLGKSTSAGGCEGERPLCLSMLLDGSRESKGGER